MRKLLYSVILASALPSKAIAANPAYHGLFVCVTSAADRYSTAAEPASTIADAAFGQCAREVEDYRTDHNRRAMELGLRSSDPEVAQIFDGGHVAVLRFVQVSGASVLSIARARRAAAVRAKAGVAAYPWTASPRLAPAGMVARQSVAATDKAQSPSGTSDMAASMLAVKWYFGSSGAQ